MFCNLHILCDSCVKINWQSCIKSVEKNCEYTKRLNSCFSSYYIDFLHPPVCSPPWSSQGLGGIPLARKLCYALGGIPYQLTTIAMSISLQLFLLDVVQMQASYVSMILFVGRAWDAVTDPLVGYLVSRSKRTPIGKLIPWLVLSTPFAVLSYLLLWFKPPRSMSQSISVLWFFTASCLFETLMSCYRIPYLSLNMFLGGGQRDRDSATTYRMTMEIAAMILASLIQGQAVAVYNTERQETCQQLDQAHEIPQSTPLPQTASLQETQKAFLTSSLVIGAMFFLCSLVLFLGVKEQQTPLSPVNKVRPPFLTSLKMLICHIPYQRLVLGFMFSSMALQMSWSNFVLLCSHVAGLGTQFKYLLLAALCSAFITVPMWQAVLLRIGKKTTALIGLSLFIPAVIVPACVPSNLPVFITMCILMGFSSGVVILVPWSMLPDVVDHFALRHPSCKDLEPLFFSCYAFCNKLAGSLSIGISTMTLQFVDYRPGACNHGDGVLTALTVLFSPVPIALLLIGMVFFYFYPIDERQLQEQLTTVHSEEQQPHAGVASTSHNNTETNTLSKSDPSPCCHNRDEKCSVKLSAHSDIPKSPSAECCRPKSVVQSKVKAQCHEQRLSPHQRSGEAGLSRNLLKNDPGSFSSKSNVRSIVSWV
ncbi:sodium-dependent lysophosphatidylcholine symporter 1-B-like [Trachinotus anak]|uniref:sodium-dependent lysophosphatidylcholine symporter 1-B-like n=1 Tax=Trachinotus anak TaxID=443729 RepID=UPI0039F1CEC7